MGLVATIVLLGFGGFGIFTTLTKKPGDDSEE